ncbi:hypothetical protein [Azospirillum doebereinerae]|uniref:DUF2256 domain-containing protein n=1 Tax=Azospirillum doebereinerae TaxID=92933 RepID=A0A433J8E9_9PROT|nr:hypothetical protein [Azospirillum doebereinerae]RUQ70259.1 hypothetical protein EJ913_14800 [Azospirillum doebereinerae]
MTATTRPAHHAHARQLHCACCGRPFARPSMRGPAPLYCSADCQKQMRVRMRVWNEVGQARPERFRRAS